MFRKGVVSKDVSQKEENFKRANANVELFSRLFIARQCSMVVPLLTCCPQEKAGHWQIMHILLPFVETHLKNANRLSGIVTSQIGSSSSSSSSNIFFNIDGLKATRLSGHSKIDGVLPLSTFARVTCMHRQMNELTEGEKWRAHVFCE